MKKSYLIGIAATLWAITWLITEGWPMLKESNTERNFLSDELIQSTQCLVALEYVSPDIGEPGNSWSREARKLYDAALQDAARNSGDAAFDVGDRSSVAQHNIAVATRISQLSNLAINRAREDIGWGTGNINSTLVKKWASSEFCQNARVAYLQSEKSVINEASSEETNRPSDAQETAPEGASSRNIATVSTAEGSAGICQGLDEATTADQVDCLDGKFTKADGELNKTYRSIMASLSDSQKSALKKEQIGWIKEKESRCNEVGAEFEGGTMQTVLIKDCLVEMTEKRLSYLNSYVAESPISD